MHFCLHCLIGHKQQKKETFVHSFLMTAVVFRSEVGIEMQIKGEDEKEKEGGKNRRYVSKVSRLVSIGCDK